MIFDNIPHRHAEDGCGSKYHSGDRDMCGVGDRRCQPSGEGSSVIKLLGGRALGLSADTRSSSVAFVVKPVSLSRFG